MPTYTAINPERAAEAALKLRPAYSPVLLRKQSECHRRPSECSPLGDEIFLLLPTWPPMIEPERGRQLHLCSRITLSCTSAVVRALGPDPALVCLGGTCLGRHVQASQLTTVRL